MKRYAVMLHAHVEIDDLDRIINYQDQGWDGYADEFHSLVVNLYKWIEVEAEGEGHIKMYVNALNAMMHDITADEWHELGEDDHIN